jgi:hypothetical protein
MASTLAVLVASPATAQDVHVFRASSAWALDYGDDYCRLMRDFSDGTETIGLFIERTQPGPMMRLIVLGDGVKLFRGSQEIGYRMLPSGAPRTVSRLRFETGDGQQYLNLGPATFADMPTPAPGAAPIMPPPYTREGETSLAATVVGIALDRGLVSPVVIETGELAQAASALQACADDLVSSWGLDAERHKHLSRPAMPSAPTAGWIAGDTIPFGDFSKLSGGNNEFRVMVDRSGKATSCHIHWPTLGETLNEKICRSVLEKSVFMPALDEQGEAIDSYWTTSVFFLMPPFGTR